MAYIFLTSNSQSLYKIAANDAEKQKIVGHFPESSYVQQTISDTDFENLRLNTHVVKIENGEGTVTELEEPMSFLTQEELNQYIEEHKNVIGRFLQNFSNNENQAQWSSYYDQLVALDTGSLSYPFAKSLEKHFQESDLPYYSILELP
tara:strand:+ start:1047 stop:1490 length:444 start_codon:yes stop_codon:yes gene_type:complete